MLKGKVGRRIVGDGETERVCVRLQDTHTNRNRRTNEN